MPRPEENIMNRTTSMQPLRALRAVTRLVRNPEDTEQVFHVIAALSGNTLHRIATRFRLTATGARVLRERRSLLARLADRAWLESLPEGTLGRAYLAFCARAGISPEGLVEASQAAPPLAAADEDERLINHRLRDMHDLWHVVLGYETDVLGEVGVLGFTFAQTLNPAFGLVLLATLVKEHGEARLFPLMHEAFRRGLRAEWLPAQDWEALLALPLAQVRRELRVGDLPAYEPLAPAAFAGA